MGRPLRATARLACLAAFVACHGSSPPRDESTGTIPTRAADAGPDAAACVERCRHVVLSRHDTCGRRAGPPWPADCADSNDQMQLDCEASCAPP